MKILVATTNHHKLREIRDIMMMPFMELLSLDEFPNVPNVVENGKTFAENAMKKAAELARATGYWTLADDSGLEVAALGGRPGVLSARYAGEPVSYPANNRKLLDEMENAADRSARFVCVIALSDPEGHCRTVTGTCDGTITTEPRGENGFGYDPIFMPTGDNMTFAEMEPEEKNQMSHRAAALRKASAEWENLLEKEATSFCEEGEVFEKIMPLESELQSELLDAMLEERGIPHINRSYHSSPFNGLFQMTEGWGYVEAPPRCRDEILAIAKDLKESKSESGDGAGVWK